MASITCAKCGNIIPFDVAMNQAVELAVAGRQQQLEEAAQGTIARREQQLREELAREQKQEVERQTAAMRDAMQTAERLSKEEADKHRRELETIKLEADKVRREAEETALRQQREMEAKEQEARIEREKMQLEMDRRLRDERQVMQEQLRLQVQSEQQLKDAESRTVIEGLTKQIEELKIAAAKSQQLQGEAQEVALEDALRMAFPDDLVSPVPKGFKGADCILQVRAGSEVVGKIIFESKRTKAWANDWIGKLKDDQRTAQAEIAVLVTTAFPAEIKNRTGNVEGVWITDFQSAMGQVMALRAGLIEVSRVVKLTKNGAGKDAEVLAFITGTEFRQSIQAIAETFIAFQEELSAEKRAAEKNWRKRETTIRRALTATMKVHGSLQGILGSGAIPDIDETAARQLTA